MRLKQVGSIFIATLLLFSTFSAGLRSLASADQVNLIANASAETVSGSTVAGWTPNSWGTNDANVSTTSDAHTGTNALKITTTTHTDGDAKWMPDPVAVTAGQQYTYADYYKSTAATEIDAAYYDASGNVSYYYITGDNAASTWQQTNVTFTVPSGMQKVVIMHILPAIGTLTTDDFSLVSAATTPTPPPTNEGIIANPSAERSTNGQPDNWLNSSWGTNTTAFTYATSAHTGSHSLMTTVSNYTDGDAKWYFQPVSLTAGKEYTFSAWFRSSAQIGAVVAYQKQDGTMQYATLPTPQGPSATTWKQYKTQFTVPTGTTTTTVYMLLAGNGWAQTDDYNLVAYKPTPFKRGIVTLTFDDGWKNGYTNGLPLLKKYGVVSTQYIISGYIGAPGYMTKAQIMAFKNQGSEIGSHTVSHPHLINLTATQLDNQLKNSQTKLQNLFGSGQATNIASPYGEYNDTVIAAMKKYYKAHRSTDVGFNSKDNFNPYNVVVQNVDYDTTNAQVAAWVAKAKTDKTWLVLVYHQVEDTIQPGDIYAVKTSNLNTQLKNLKATGVTVETFKAALAEVKAQF